MKNMVGILISTVYKKESILLSIRDFNIKKAIFLVDKEENEQQKKSISEIKRMFGGVIDIVEKKIEVYDIVDISREIVKIIDSADQSNDIFVDVTHGRKPQTFGTLFACYARNTKIKKIVYWTEEDKKMITLPKISFSVSDKDRNVLDKIESYKNFNELANSIGVSRPMLYRYIKTLEQKGLLEKVQDGYKVTDAGKIAIL